MTLGGVAKLRSKYIKRETDSMEFKDKSYDVFCMVEVDVYHTNRHAFDMLRPDDELSRRA